MNLLPYQHSILVLPFTAEQLAVKLRKKVKPFSEDEYLSKKSDDIFAFNGWVKNDKFRISRRIKHAENFLPLIAGRIEATSKGSIVFISYRLFPATLFFMSFLCLSVIVAALFFLLAKDWLTSGFLLLITVGIYSISVLDFNQKVKISKNLLEKILLE